MDEISILKARIATLEANMAPKPKHTPNPDYSRGSAGCCGMRVIQCCL